MITVEVADDQVPNRVILWERDDQHPDGECYIASDGRTYDVAPTLAVRRLLADGVLVQVDAGEPKSRRGRKAADTADADDSDEG